MEGPKHKPSMQARLAAGASTAAAREKVRVPLVSADENKRVERGKRDGTHTCDERARKN